jgi:hypothetical protein
VASVLAAAAPCFAARQQEPTKNPAEKPEAAEARTPVTIPANIIGLGAKIAEAAPDGVQKWARGYAKRELLGRDGPPEDEAVEKAFEARFSKAAARARAAGIFLAWYEAYQRISDDQQVFHQRIVEIDRDISRMESDLTRFRTLTPSLGDPARDAQARLERRLENARRQRDFFRTGLEALNPRVELCLKRLTALYETVKDADPAAIQGLK